MKDVSWIYIQVAVEAFWSLAFAKVYTSKMPITVANSFTNARRPFYDSQGVKIGLIPTDGGRMFCGKPDQHPHELLLPMEYIEHCTAQIRHPHTIGLAECMNRTLLD